MSTLSLVSKIKRYAKGWGDPDILKMIEQGQDELFSAQAASMHFVGGGNKGFPPYLKTVAGTYRYEIKTENLSESLTITVGNIPLTVIANQVISVFQDASSTAYGKIPLGVPYTYRPGYGTERILVADIPVRSVPVMGNLVATVEFFEDPGTSTDRYFVDFTYLPPRLTGTGIPLFVSPEFEQAIQDYVIGEIQMLENGKFNEFQQRFTNEWKPRFALKMDRGAQKFIGETEPVF